MKMYDKRYRFKSMHFSRFFSTFESSNYPMKRLILLLLFSTPLLAQSDFQKGEKQFLAGNYSQAKVYLEKAVVQNAVNAKALEYLGDIYCLNSQWENALPFYEKLLSIAPREADYFYKYGGVLGMIAKESNKFKALSLVAAIRGSFEKAIALDKNHVEARWALIELYLQLPAIVGGSEWKAEKYANQLIAISQVDGYLAKGYIAEYYNRYKTAESNYKKAISIGQSKITYEKLANLYRNKMNQPQKAAMVLADYKKLASSNNS